MLYPIPSKLLKEVLPEVIDPLLAIINSSLSLGLSHNRGRPLGENVVNRRRFIELREIAAEQL